MTRVYVVCTTFTQLNPIITVDFRKMKADIGSFDMHSLTHDLLELDSDQEIEQAEWNHWQEINDLGASSVATYVPDTMTLFIQRVSVGSTTLDSEDINVNLDD